MESDSSNVLALARLIALEKATAVDPTTCDEGVQQMMPGKYRAPRASDFQTVTSEIEQTDFTAVDHLKMRPPSHGKTTAAEIDDIQKHWRWTEGNRKQRSKYSRKRKPRKSKSR